MCEFVIKFDKCQKKDSDTNTTYKKKELSHDLISLAQMKYKYRYKLNPYFLN